MRALGIALISVGVAALVICIVAVSLGVELRIATAHPSGRRGVDFLVGLGTFGASLIAITVAIWAWIYGVLHQRRRLRLADKDSWVIVAQRDEESATTISRLADPGATVPTRVPSYLALCFNGLGVEVWGRDESHPLVSFGWDAVRDISTATVVRTRSLPALAIELDVSGRSETLRFMPSRDGWELWPVFDPQTVSAIARKIREARASFEQQ